MAPRFATHTPNKFRHLERVSPTQVRVNDVLNAAQYWVDKTLFEANFADFNKMAAIFQ